MFFTSPFQIFALLTAIVALILQLSHLLNKKLANVPNYSWIFLTLAFLSLGGHFWFTFTYADDLTFSIVDSSKISSKGSINSSDLAGAVRVSDKEILAYQSDREEYLSTAYKEGLTEEELLLYQGMLYAVDNGYNSIQISGADAYEEQDFQDIYAKLSLDSPFVSGNYTVGSGVLNQQSIGVLYMPDTRMADMKALSIAQYVVSTLDPTMSDWEKAYALYGYLSENVTYVDYADTTNVGNKSYLYTALVDKETNCEGFANAYSLLCNLAGVPCYEETYSDDGLRTYYENLGYSADALEGQVSHIWNVVKLGECYYTVDCSAGSMVYQSLGQVGEAFFAFDRGVYSDMGSAFPPNELSYVERGYVTIYQLGGEQSSLGAKIGEEGYMFFHYGDDLDVGGLLEALVEECQSSLTLYTCIPGLKEEGKMKLGIVVKV